MNSIAQHLSSLPRPQATAALLRCCGASHWVEGMLASSPFENDESLHRKAESLWASLTPKDWLEAFAQHPRIGERVARAADSSATQSWSTQEQSGVSDSDEAARRALQRGNEQYQQRFGHVFLICATGKNSEEILTALEIRLAHEPTQELAIAAAEQAKITRLRLEKLPAEAH